MGCHGVEAEGVEKVFKAETERSCCCHCDELATRRQQSSKTLPYSLFRLAAVTRLGDCML